MNLPNAPLTYDQHDQARMRREIGTQDRKNVKQGVAASLVLKDPSGQLWQLTVSTSGVVSATLL